MACAPHSKKNKLSGVTPSIATLWASKPEIETFDQSTDPDPCTPSSSQGTVAISVERVGSSKRAATNHNAWTLTRPWIEHRLVNDDFRCIPCMWAIENNRIPGFVYKSRLIGIKFVTTGWNDYRVGIQALDKHANGDAHKGCMMTWQTFQTKSMTEAYITTQKQNVQHNASKSFSLQ